MLHSRLQLSLLKKEIENAAESASETAEAESMALR